MKKNYILIPIVVLISFLGGIFFRSAFDAKSTSTPGDAVSNSVKFYTCAMHHHIRLQDPNARCPLCGMELTAVTSYSGQSDGPTELTLSPRALKLAEVETTPVERKFVSTEIRMVGKVEYDETKLSYITAWVPGRLDRLYVDYTGVTVNKGDHLAYLYSPELLSAQEELLQGIRTSQSLGKSSSEFLKEKSLTNIESSKEKLRLWGLSEAQIEAIIQKGETSDHITINSPISGIVVHKNAVEGMYVSTGDSGVYHRRSFSGLGETGCL